MTVRAQVMTAVAALIASALPEIEIAGFTAETAKPIKLGYLGALAAAPGEAGEPEIEMSPLTYVYSHPIAIEMHAGPNADDDALDAMLQSINIAIMTDRFLGGRCIWLDATPPSIIDEPTPGGPSIRTASFNIMATYASPTPL